MYYNVPWDDLKNGKPVPPINVQGSDGSGMGTGQRGNYIKKELLEIYVNPVIKNRSYGSGFLDGVREGLRVISEATTVDAIEIPKNATYGDMIMKVLESAGNYKQEESNDVMYIYEEGTPKLMRVAVDGKLWNKPFKRDREEMN